jgi:hypothetical protein
MRFGQTEIIISIFHETKLSLNLYATMMGRFEPTCTLRTMMVIFEQSSLFINEISYKKNHN